MSKEYERHPLSALWGDMPVNEFAELVESVRESGSAVVRTLNGQVLDGWHRYRACLEAGVNHIIAEWHGDDPVAFVIRENALRRHLTPGQRAACVVACYQWAKSGVDTDRLKGGEPGSPPIATVSEMAAEAGTTERTIQQAKVAQEAGLGGQTRSGELSPKAAAAQARGEPNLPKGPTRTEKLEAENDLLQVQLQEKIDRIEELERALREARLQISEYPHEREIVANEREVTIRTLRSQVNEWQNKYNEELQARRYWERWAKANGWERKEGNG